MKIGIPRGMNYYNYYPFWHGFFTWLGIEPVLSAKTTKKTISDGSRIVVPETCLPVKIYMGHVLDLIDNKKIDVLYIPSHQSIAPKIYNCSKIRGLPDLVRNVVKRNFLLIEPTLDKSEKNQGLYQYLYDSVAPLGITDKKLIKKASKAGWECQNKFNAMLRSGMNLNDAIDKIIKGDFSVETQEEKKKYSVNVAVISHGYNLYDNRVSMGIFDKLEKLDAKAYAPENLSVEQMEKGYSVLDTTLYWANENEMTGAAGYYMVDNNIDGIITLTSFGCGPDSIMIERITRFARRYNKPLLNLTVDEHTGEAGFITRLEAFTDMLLRRKRETIIKSLSKQFGEQKEQKLSQNQTVS
ncbi:MAG TPA: acyl-CoA dehydratase activase-related protein [Candidatus Gastranaerophilales bacterium]|nr:acyl-CoA dehydratase activase-related protein [Candidatus Gastranaerophilales bacterium]